MKINYIKRQNIDTEKWNHLVLQYPQGICATAWYLDAVTSGQWDALILEDYEAILPIPYQPLALGLRRLYQPPFTQQLGVFSAKKDNISDLLSYFLAAIPKKYIHWQINLQAKTPILSASNGTIFQKLNLRLPLYADYESLQKFYSKGLQKKLRQAAKFDFHIGAATPSQLHAIYMANTAPKLSFFSEKVGNIMLNVMEKAIDLQQGKVVGVYEKTNDHLLFACFLLKNPTQLLNPFGAYTKEGREKHATIFLYDYLIQTNASQELSLDFMGSSLPEVAAFFKNFGCVAEYYYRMEQHKIPFFAFLQKTREKIMS
jgi:hypothetical protein